MKDKKFADTEKHHVATSLRMLEEVKGKGRAFAGDSWFSSVDQCIAQAKSGDYFTGEVKTCTSLYPKKILVDFTPLEHGKFLAYEATFEGVTLWAVGVRKGYKKVRCMVTTCRTTAFKGDEDSWDDWDKDGH